MGTLASYCRQLIGIGTNTSACDRALKTATEAETSEKASRISQMLHVAQKKSNKISQEASSKYGLIKH